MKMANEALRRDAVKGNRNEKDVEKRQIHYMHVKLSYRIQF